MAPSPSRSQAPAAPPSSSPSTSQQRRTADNTHRRTTGSSTRRSQPSLAATRRNIYSNTLDSSDYYNVEYVDDDDDDDEDEKEEGDGVEYIDSDASSSSDFDEDDHDDMDGTGEELKTPAEAHSFLSRRANREKSQREARRQKRREFDMLHSQQQSSSSWLESLSWRARRLRRDFFRRRRYRRPRLVLYLLLGIATIYYSLFGHWHILPRKKPIHAPSIYYKNVEWERYAYSLYATDTAYLCNAIMIFEALDRLGSRAQRVLFHPSTWDTDVAGPSDRVSQLLVRARHQYHVRLMPVNMAKLSGHVSPASAVTPDDAEGGGGGGAAAVQREKTWNAAFMKFMAWTLVEYVRVLYLDSDVTLNNHLDELFLLPEGSPVAMTRAYWQLPHSPAPVVPSSVQDEWLASLKSAKKWQKASIDKDEAKDKTKQPKQRRGVLDNFLPKDKSPDTEKQVAREKSAPPHPDHDMDIDAALAAAAEAGDNATASFLAASGGMPPVGSLRGSSSSSSSISGSTSGLRRFRLTSMLILLEPSEADYDRLMTAARPDYRIPGDFDMEILNSIYGDIATVLPHRNFALLSGEFRQSARDHGNFLGNAAEKWEPVRAMAEASVVHFSDWPLPKPWVMWPHTLIGAMMPKCQFGADGLVEQCLDREIWTGLYDDFRRRRKRVCGLLSEVAPEWPPKAKAQAKHYKGEKSSASGGNEEDELEGSDNDGSPGGSGGNANEGISEGSSARRKKGKKKPTGTDEDDKSTGSAERGGDGTQRGGKANMGVDVDGVIGPVT